MKSEAYKQTMLDLAIGDGRTRTSQITVEEEVCCMCPADNIDSFSFYRSGSFGRKDNESMRCSSCRADEAGIPVCSSCTDVDLHSRSCRRVERGAGGCPAHLRIRWADDCHRELTRQHPRKKYVRRPAQPPPLKSILKGT